MRYVMQLSVRGAHSEGRAGAALLAVSKLAARSDLAAPLMRTTK